MTVSFFGFDFAVVLILRVRFFTKIQDQIKNPDQ